MVVNRFIPQREPAPLPGAALLGLDLVDDFQVARSINEGLSTVVVSRLAQELGVSESRALSAVAIPESTFHSRKRAGRLLTPEESSRVYRIARATAAARTYFEGDSAAARRWLSNPKEALAGSTPLEFSRTPEGSDYVIRLLQRLEHGVFS